MDESLARVGVLATERAAELSQTLVQTGEYIEPSTQKRTGIIYDIMDLWNTDPQEDRHHEHNAGINTAEPDARWDATEGLMWDHYRELAQVANHPNVTEEERRVARQLSDRIDIDRILGLSGPHYQTNHPEMEDFWRRQDRQAFFDVDAPASMMAYEFVDHIPDEEIKSRGIDPREHWVYNKDMHTLMNKRMREAVTRWKTDPDIDAFYKTRERLGIKAPTKNDSFMWNKWMNL